jgi:hypothetical protein
LRPLDAGSAQATPTWFKAESAACIPCVGCLQTPLGLQLDRLVAPWRRKPTSRRVKASTWQSTPRTRNASHTAVRRPIGKICPHESVSVLTCMAVHCVRPCRLLASPVPQSWPHVVLHHRMPHPTSAARQFQGCRGFWVATRVDASALDHQLVENVPGYSHRTLPPRGTPCRFPLFTDIHSDILR